MGTWLSLGAELLREAGVAYGIDRMGDRRRAKKHETGGHAVAAHDPDEHEEGEKKKDSHTKSKKAAHATPAKVTVAATIGAAIGRDASRWIDALLTDYRDVLHRVIAATPEFDKRRIMARLMQASQGRAPMSENTLVTCLVKAVTVYEGEARVPRRDARKEVRRLDGLSDANFWVEMEALNHNAIAQVADRAAGGTADVVEQVHDWLGAQKLFGIIPLFAGRRRRSTSTTGTTGGTP